MQHTKSDQQLLDEMSVQEKLDRTTPEDFKERWMLILEDKNFYITKSDMPYKKSKEHLILWIKQTDFDTMSFVWSIMYDYKQYWYSIQRNQPNKQSVKREHIHLIKRQWTDKN